MEIPDNMIEHIREAARNIEHGEILIKLNQARNIVDVKAGNTVRFYVKEKGKPEVKTGGKRDG